MQAIVVGQMQVADRVFPYVIGQVQMLVAEMARSERQQRRSLVPELTISELELLSRLEGGGGGGGSVDLGDRERPARPGVGRMASMDAVHTSGRRERGVLGRIASLRERSRHRTTPPPDGRAGPRRPLLRTPVTVDSSGESSPTGTRCSGRRPSDSVPL